MKKPKQEANILTEIKRTDLSNVQGGVFRLSDFSDLRFNLLKSPPRPRPPEVRFVSAAFGRKA